MQIVELDTKRLKLRQWRTEDFPCFAMLSSDQEVMKYFPKTLSQIESDAMAERCKNLIAERGWGFWATELKSTGAFIGFVGLHEPKQSMPFAPCVEIGWWLLKTYWGQGYATEAAREALKFSFETLNLDEVVSFTVVANQRSRAVMERLGMVDTKQNFNHPDLSNHHPLSEHVLYKITKPEWRNNKDSSFRL